MKNKKPILFIIILLLALVVIGVTVAYYTSNDTFSNEFNTSVYKMIAEENFQSPDNWTPGTTTPKEVYAINQGDVEAAVRIKIEESWIGNDDTELDLSDSHDNRAAIIKAKRCVCCCIFTFVPEAEASHHTMHEPINEDQINLLLSGGTVYEKAVYSRTCFINGDYGNRIRIEKQIQRSQLQFQQHHECISGGMHLCSQIKPPA